MSLFLCLVQLVTNLIYYFRIIPKKSFFRKDVVCGTTFLDITERHIKEECHILYISTVYLLLREDPKPFDHYNTVKQQTLCAKSLR